MLRKIILSTAALATILSAAPVAPALASSHMDAPLISFDDPANITDVYAFVQGSKSNKTLTAAMSVYPFEEPGIGPNIFRFDPDVVYEIHVALDGDIAKGKPDLTYRYDFKTDFVNDDTVLMSYLGVLTPPKSGKFAPKQNMRQTYTVTRIDHRNNDKAVVIGHGIVPPNNQGRVTPLYNKGDNGDKPARDGVGSTAKLDAYTKGAIASFKGYRSFAGQRDDAFYGDIQSIFDLEFTFGTDKNTSTKPFDSQGGYNVHTIVLEIPFEELDGADMAGVYATTSRMKNGKLVQVGRQGNPLFNEAFVAVQDKDKYNSSSPSTDKARLAGYAKSPELSAALGVEPIIPGLLESIYLPDLIKVDLTTPAAKLAGNDGFNRLSVFGGDVLKSQVQDPFANGGFIPGGWPNGRRFGDDVIDIGFIALGIAGKGPDYTKANLDRVPANDMTYNTVFPYAPTPQNGRVHGHHGDKP